MNVLLIDIDTLRADHLGCYGYAHPTSPNIDRLASQGVVYEQCFAPGIPTTPAHTTLYTGAHPLTHGIVTHGGSLDLDRRFPVLPELLQRAGLTTCAVDNLFDLKPWLARGYEFYVNPSHRHAARLMVTAEEMNARAIPWLRSHAGEPFFLFVHYWDPHTPYTPPRRHQLFWDGRDPCDPSVRTFEPIKQTPFWGMWGDTWFRKLGPITDADYVVALYDGEIHRVDEAVGELLSALDETGAADDTLVVLTADHGEEMYEHGIFFDHHGLYEGNIRVPLILRHPSAAPGTRIAAMVDHRDVGPTVLAAAGGASPATFEGVSLLDCPSPERAFVTCCENTWQSKWALRTREHKLITSRRPDAYGTPLRELYDLRRDPGELANVAEQEPEQTQQMEEELEAWIAQGLSRSGIARDPVLEQDFTLGKRWETWRARA